jgi:hypothetical protein
VSDHERTSEQERAARYSDLFENHEHVSDCAYCPICATIAVVRKTRPEVLEHLSIAARELIAAAGIFLQEAEGIVGAAEAASRAVTKDAKGGNVRRIDIS